MASLRKKLILWRASSNKALGIKTKRTSDYADEDGDGRADPGASSAYARVQGEVGK